MDPKLLVKVLAIEEMPEHTMVCGDVVMVNVDGPSPDWVLELLKTKAGGVLLRRVLAGIVMNHERKKIVQQIIEKEEP